MITLAVMLYLALLTLSGLALYWAVWWEGPSIPRWMGRWMSRLVDYLDERE